MTRRWGNSPKCWNTIDIFERRTPRSCSGDMRKMSMPSIITSPRVGSMSRARQRTNDDLPLPDSPITTKVSPRPTSKEMSRTPTV